MARTSHLAKALKKPKFAVRQHNRCPRCGRPARVLPEIPHLPDVLPIAGVAGREIPRSAKGELVTMNTTSPIADMLTRIRNSYSKWRLPAKLEMPPPRA